MYMCVSVTLVCLDTHACSAQHCKSCVQTPMVLCQCCCCYKQPND
jgi:hypothetical protein